MFEQNQKLPAVYDQHFQFIRRNDLDQQLSTIFRHWNASPLERAEFVGWAWVVATASDFVARTEDAVRAMEQVRIERDELHTKLTEKLHQTATVDLAMVSRRMFLDWLCSEIASARVAA
ncbi:MAG: hypothetical protein QM817_22295 [Archangium sp.]